MNAYRYHSYCYKAILSSGDVILLGTSRSETDDNGGYLRSEFGGVSAEFHFCFEDEDYSVPNTFIPIIAPDDISQFWNSAKNHSASQNIRKMLDFCNIASENVIGIIVTATHEDNWQCDQTDTKIIIKPAT